MINLYKVNGKLKARVKLLADYTEAIVANAKEVWLKEKQDEYDGLYPKYETIIVIDELTKEEVEKQVEIVYEHTFDTWLLETEVVSEAVEAVLNEYGMVEVEAKVEVTKLLREFIAPEVTEAMLDTYLASRYAELRATEYPKIEDYIDGVVKGDQEQIQNYIDKCLEVKAKYPKPE